MQQTKQILETLKKWSKFNWEFKDFLTRDGFFYENILVCYFSVKRYSSTAFSFFRLLFDHVVSQWQFNGISYNLWWVWWRLAFCIGNNSRHCVTRYQHPVRYIPPSSVSFDYHRKRSGYRGISKSARTSRKTQWFANLEPIHLWSLHWIGNAHFRDAIPHRRVLLAIRRYWMSVLGRFVQYLPSWIPRNVAMTGCCWLQRNIHDTLSYNRDFG